MSDSHNFKKLKEEILALSMAQRDWDVARKEWALVDIWENDEPEKCLCGHYPIIEMCHIKNRITGKAADVGNVCVKRFFGVRADLIFTCIKKIKKDREKSLNADTVAFFREVKVLNAWEYDFLQGTMKKRKLSLKQMNKRTEINEKILRAIARRGFQDLDIEEKETENDQLPNLSH